MTPLDRLRIMVDEEDLGQGVMLGDLRRVTLADLAPLLGWIPCDHEFHRAMNHAGHCPSCKGICWLPDDETIEGMAEALYMAQFPGNDYSQVRSINADNQYLRLAHAAWQAQARILKERMGA